MKFKMLGLLALTSVVVFSVHARALDSDYNDALRDELNQNVDDLYPQRHHVVVSSNDAVVAQTAPVNSAQTVTNPVVLPATSAAKTTTTTNTATSSAAQAKTSTAPAAATTTTTAVTTTTTAPAAASTSTATSTTSAPAAPTTTATTQSGQLQPVTTVDAPTYKESETDQLRREREEAEHQTESKLLEKLEADRLQAEKARDEHIFTVAATPTPAPSAAPVVEAAPVAPAQPATAAAVPAAPAAPTAQVQAAPAVMPVPPPAELSKEDAAATAASANDDKVTAEERKAAEDKKKEEEKNKNQWAVGALAGFASYPTATNVSGLYAAGAKAEVYFPSRIGVELSGVYSQYNIYNLTPCYYCSGVSYFRTLNQVDIDAALKYKLFDGGSITPVVGVVAGYTRRSYYDQVFYGYTGGDTGSNAFSGGLLAGVDVKLADHFVLGADFRYLWNISYQTDNPYAYAYYGTYFGTPLEQLSYYMATISLKYTF